MSKIGNLKTLLENKEQSPMQKFEEFKNLFLESRPTQKTDLNLLLQWVVENKVSNFSEYYDLLKSNGADVNFFDQRGTGFLRLLENKTNLMRACEKGSHEIVRILVLDKEIDLKLLDRRNRNALFYAIESKGNQDTEKCLKIILDHDPTLINSKTNNQKSMLFAAIQKNKIQIVKFLLEKGIGVNDPLVDTGNTPLHEAVKMNKGRQVVVQKSIVKLLLEKGANPAIKNKQAKTPLDIDEKQIRSYQEAIDKDKLEGLEIEKLKQGQSRDQSQKKRQIKKMEVDKQIDSKREQILKEKYSNQEELQRENENRRNDREPNRNGPRKFRAKASNSFASTHPLMVLNEPQHFQLLRANASKYFQSDRRLLSSSSKEIPQKQLQDSDQSHGSQTSSSQEESCEAMSQSDPFLTTQSILRDLDDEILDFERMCQRDYNAAFKDLSGFLSELKQIVKPMDLQVQVFGSFATKLWLQHCDVDLLLIPKSLSHGENNSQILNRLHSIFSKNYEKYRNIGYTYSGKVLMIRLQPHSYNGNGRSRKIDISVLEKNHNGQAAVMFINDVLQGQIRLRPVYYVLKSLAHSYRLYDPKNGGIRSYALFIMLLSFVQNMPNLNQIQNQSQNSKGKSSGQLLMDFLYYFGYVYEYDYIRNPDNQLVMGIIIRDPININNYLGKNVNFGALQVMFKAAYIGFHGNIGKGVTGRYKGIGKRLQFAFDTRRLFVTDYRGESRG